MPQITIHRGANTIGGSCVEIKHNSSRILIDIGTPLMGNGGGELDEKALSNPSIENKILPDIKGLYKDEDPKISTVLISHSHIDHCGLLNYIHPGIPVYCSPGTQSLIKIGQVFYPEPNKVFCDNVNTFEHWKSIKLGPFKITSYLIDHSGFDASCFLIKADNKKIFYTGDFRGHGRKSKLTQQLVKKPIPEIDCLLMEGTTLGGKHHVGYETEDEVQNAFYDIFSRQKDVSFVAASGSNIDRLVSLYKATRKSNKTLVLDLYTYYVLDQLKKVTPGLPPFNGDNIRIFYIRGHAQDIADHLDKSILFKYKNRKIEIEEILKKRSQMVLKLPISAKERISNALVKDDFFDDVKFVFSMWQGYLKKDGRYENFCRQFNAKLVQVHVSGHAYIKDLKRFADAMKPKKLVPIHTLSGDAFKLHFSNVRGYDDQETFEI